MLIEYATANVFEDLIVLNRTAYSVESRRCCPEKFDFASFVVLCILRDTCDLLGDICDQDLKLIRICHVI